MISSEKTVTVALRVFSVVLLCCLSFFGGTVFKSRDAYETYSLRLPSLSSIQFGAEIASSPKPQVHAQLQPLASVTGAMKPQQFIKSQEAANGPHQNIYIKNNRNFLHSIETVFDPIKYPSIVITFFNVKYLKMFNLFYNWYDYSMGTNPESIYSKQNINNTILMTVCIDLDEDCDSMYNNPSNKELFQKCTNCVFFSVTTLLESLITHYEYNMCYKFFKSDNCKKLDLWGIRVHLLKYLMHESDYNLLFTDADALWLQNPFYYFHKNILNFEKMDLIGSRAPYPYQLNCGHFYEYYSKTNNLNYTSHIMENKMAGLSHDRICFGFVYFRNSPGSKLLAQLMMADLDRYHQDDQITLNCVVSDHKHFKYSNWSVDDVNSIDSNGFNRIQSIAPISNDSIIDLSDGSDSRLLQASKVNNVYIEKVSIVKSHLAIVLLPINLFARFCQWYGLEYNVTIIAHCNIGGYGLNKFENWKKNGFELLFNVPGLSAFDTNDTASSTQLKPNSTTQEIIMAPNERDELE